MTAEDKKPEERIDQYLLGQATAEDVEVLNKLLAEDEQMRKLYRFRVALDGGYREAAIRSESSKTMVDGSSANIEAKQSSRKSFLYGFAVAAASLAAVGLFAVTQWSLFDRETPTSKPSFASGSPVARLVASVDADWRDIEPMPGTLLETGTYSLDAGTVELEFNRGARVTLQGPSRFELKNANLLHVSFGNLIARIPEEAIGFTITTDETEVVDLGTEFGLRVGEERQTEVHVIEGLVEVFERPGFNADSPDERSAESIRIEQGQAIRWKVNEGEKLASEVIPAQSIRGVLGGKRRSALGLTFLQGNIRLKEIVSANELKSSTTSWIEVIPEKSGVLLEQEIPATLISPGNYRLFGESGHVVPAGTRVDSYLIHFRSAQPVPIRGVIKFDQRIVGLVCVASQLAATDAIVGRPGVEYPVGSKLHRGLEPRALAGNRKPGKGGGLMSDEVTASNDMKTLGLSVNVDPVQGVDQLRVLVLSKDP